MKLILEEKTITPELSKKFAQELWETHLSNAGNFSVFLEGGLGAGKTFLVREILFAAGIDTEVPSPTYTIVNEFNTVNNKFAHFDFYRLSDPADFFARGLSEIAEDNKINTFVEWSDKISETAQRGFSGKKFLIRIDHGQAVGARHIRVYQNET